MRLEKLSDNRSWVRLHFADGTAVTGRMLSLGQDYVELESYGEFDKPHARDYSKHLIPLHLIKLITVESSSFAEAEKNRLNFLAQLDINPESMPELEK